MRGPVAVVVTGSHDCSAPPPIFVTCFFAGLASTGLLLHEYPIMLLERQADGIVCTLFSEILSRLHFHEALFVSIAQAVVLCYAHVKVSAHAMVPIAKGEVSA